MRWDADRYDSRHGFVSGYGADLVEWLNPQPGETVIDLGCGTGDLAEVIHQRGASVWGLDASAEMIAAARSKYPHLRFEVGRAESFRTNGLVDAIFSNATLHWVTDAAAAVASMYAALRPGGRLVVELGGKGNVAAIATALQQALRAGGHDAQASRQFWYYPSLGAYATLLEGQGFRVVRAAHFDRPTPLDGPEGLHNWIAMFGGNWLEGLDAPTRIAVTDEAVALARPHLCADGTWKADYVRLRIEARRS
ncbi:MAG: class I SAM-dependent methyltransferase [Bacteroidia bacterium]